MPNSVKFSKEAEDGPCLQKVGFQKTFPEVPMEIRASSGNPESRLSIPLGLGIFKRWLGNVGCAQSRSLSQNREILLHRSRNSPCSANPEFRVKS